jgi:hypothetical protein
MGSPPTAASDRDRLAALRRLSHLLDSVFRIPGTQIRFGWDPITGLLPVLGDVTSPLFCVLVLIQAYRLRIPKVVQLRMVINALIDFAFGSVPVAGTVFDVYWKANNRNMQLLERHARPGTPTTGDWLFVSLALAVLAAVLAVPFMLLAWLIYEVGFRI